METTCKPSPGSHEAQTSHHCFFPLRRHTPPAHIDSIITNSHMAERPAKKPKTEPGTTPSPSQVPTMPPPPSTGAEYSPGDLVTLVVGADKRKMITHAHSITHDSPFFKNALKKAWEDNQTRDVKLPDEQPELVARYLDFTYGRGLASSKIVSITSAGWEADPYPALINLYLFGERAANNNLRNAIISDISRLGSLLDEKGYSWIPDTKDITTIFNGTPATSPLGRLVVDMQVSWGGEMSRDDEKVAHPIFLFELVSDFSSKAARHVKYSGYRSAKLPAEDYFV